ncbi:MAG: 50S ribosomal protein L20 [Chlamydiales bacterium]|nr:50S ribosomal protein L20 [Chlamydiales bacterium]
MVRVTNAVASRRRRKRMLKRASGFFGDRKNHFRLAKDAVMKAMAFSTEHRKQKKRNFRSLWIVRIGVAAKINGLSYSKLIHGLAKAGCCINRKMLADMALRDPASFSAVAETAKKALVAA